MGCLFCDLTGISLKITTDLSMSFRDRFPIAPGHTLIIPRRHVASYFHLTSEEQADLWDLASKCRKDLDTEFHPSGYNFGINEGEAAGQTIMHVHLHLIPRYDGDQDDPRGGIRKIFPDKAVYWEDTDPPNE